MSSSSSSKYITPACGAGVYINVYSWFQPTVLVCKSMGIDGFSLRCWYIYQGVLMAPAYSAVVHIKVCEWHQPTVLLCILMLVNGFSLQCCCCSPSAAV